MSVPDAKREASRKWRGLAMALLAGAAAAGGAALVNRAVARRAERAHPPTGQFVEVDGVRLHYVERGSGSPVVLLHGNGGLVQDWEASGLLDLLAGEHRVIALDRPGFGYSERPRDRDWTAHEQAALLHAALVRLGVRDAVVVGHSWGTLVALALALEHPHDVASLVLLAGYYFPSVRADVLLLRLPAVPVLGDIMRHTVAPLLGWLLMPMFVRRLFAPAPITRSFRERFPLALALRPGQIRASAEDTALMVGSAAPLQDRHGELRMPVVFVAGIGDRIVDMRQSRRLRAKLSDSILFAVDGAGHMIHHLVPGMVAEAVASAARAAASGTRPRPVRGTLAARAVQRPV